MGRNPAKKQWKLTKQLLITHYPMHLKISSTAALEPFRFLARNLHPADHPLRFISNGVVVFHDDFHTTIPGNGKNFTQFGPYPVFVEIIHGKVHGVGAP